MKHLLHKLSSLRLLMLLAALLGMGSSTAWADTTTYIFTSASWTATSGGSAANWTSGKAGDSFVNKGIKVTTGVTGANGTSPISFTNVTRIVATYNTNKSAGAGSIAAKIGTNTEKSNSVAYSSGDGRTANYTTTFDYATPQSGSVKITVNTTTNSIYLVSVAITTATPVTGVSLNKSETTLEVGDQETLTATVAPANADNKNVSWESDDTDIATVSNGVVTAVAAGTANITVTTQDGSKTATCAVTVTAATKTAVNMTGFSATSNSIVKGNTTSTTVTNDQGGWSAAYTYTSSDGTVATVAADGTITAVKKGTARITCSLNVDGEDPVYKAGTTTSMYVDITVTNPFHNVTFSSNGSTYSGPTSVEEGESISLPAVNPGDVNGYSFQGWAAATIDGTTEDEPEYISSPIMEDADITYYAVFAEEGTSYSESEIEKTQTLQYDTWTYSGSTTDKSSYRLFGNNSYIESAAFDLSLLKKVIVYGGTYGGGSYNTFTIGDGTNTWKSGTVSGSSQTGTNEVTGGTALTGTKKLYVTVTSGDGSNNGLRISQIDIYTKKKITTASHYCTTVSALPKPVITMADVDMTWGDNDKSVAPSATIGEDAYAGSFSFTVDKAGLSVASNGKLTSSTPGTYIVTASIAATEDYQSASQTCTVTVGKQDVELDFANDLVRKRVSDGTYTQTATPTPAGYDGTITYSKEGESTSAGATVTAASGKVDFSATGSVIVKATASETAKYNSTTATYTIYVQTTPTISVSNQSIAQSETYTLDTSGFSSGDVSLSSSKSAIASVAELVVTGAAVGTATITVNTSETDTYEAGEASFTVTVTAPEASDTKPSADPVTVFYESFDKCSGTGGNDDKWNDTAGSGSAGYDNTWTTSGSLGGADQCLKMASGSNSGTITTPSITTTAGTTYTLTFKAGSWKDKSSTLSLSATGASTTLSKSSFNLTNEKFNNYEATFTAQGSSVTLTFTAAKNNQLFLDEVRITEPATPITSTSVTTTGGYATYCYQYPLNLDGISGAKAYKAVATDAETKKVRMTQITGTIMGGVPFILKADGNDDTFEIPLADESTTVPDGNLLVGTLAPTFVEQTSGDYTNFAYSKSNECFVKLGSAGNTVPANRAYLPINLGAGGGVKYLTFDFGDADAISDVRGKMEDGRSEIFNLAGQRISKLQRGINIVNGKKVLVK